MESELANCQKFELFATPLHVSRNLKYPWLRS